jgi:carbon storage regulator
MLILTRRIGEKIRINADITVTVTEIRDGKVRLGFDAPREIPVFREELIKPPGDSSNPALQPVA